MSNPAVIILDSVNGKKNKFKRFVIEDNIGESIHLHIDSMRIDFTIKDFLAFSKMVRDSLLELELLDTYSINNFDEYFLKECSNFLPNLKKIVVEEIELSKLKCIVYSNYRSDLNIIRLVSVSNTPAYKYLKGDQHNFLKYGQYNYFNMNNEKRLFQTLESIQKNGYPYEDKHIVLFGGQDIIRDGQHRAAVLAHLYGINVRIKVMVFHFDGNRHYFRKNTNNFKSLAKWILKKVRSNLTGSSIN